MKALLQMTRSKLLQEMLELHLPKSKEFKYIKCTIKTTETCGTN